MKVTLSVLLRNQMSVRGKKCKNPEDDSQEHKKARVQHLNELEESLNRLKRLKEFTQEEALRICPLI